jgi:hypothetical protein
VSSDLEGPKAGEHPRTCPRPRLDIFPASETEGTADDGVISVTPPFLNAATYLGDLNGDGTTSPADDGLRTLLALQFADRWIDFSAFGTRPTDGVLSNRELLVAVVVPGGNCASTRGVARTSPWPDGLSGVTIGVTLGGTTTNVITQAHEFGHQALGLADLYGSASARSP